MKRLVLLAHNLRSAHNVGSLLRTADGLGINEVYLTGYTPYPALGANDPRLPHLAVKINNQIKKTALGAELNVEWQHNDNIFEVIKSLRQENFTMAALEQADNSLDLDKFNAPEKLALIVGREVEGIEPEVLADADLILEIPMRGTKESFNVAVAAAIALYRLR